MSGAKAPAGLKNEGGPGAAVEKEPAAPTPDTAARDPKRGARLREANRAQVAWGRIDLEAQLPDEHVACNHHLSVAGRPRLEATAGARRPRV